VFEGSPEDLGEWQKSSFSSSGSCVEVRRGRGTVQVRDSKNRSLPCLRFAAGRWELFLAGVLAHEFSPPRGGLDE
jgi:hypothetical protein